MAICIVCKKNVTLKTGIQCQGSCSVWVHYGCLNYITDDGRKMVHEPYTKRHVYSDVCGPSWNNNYISIRDGYVKMNESANEVTQETVTKSDSQGASIYKCLSLGMISWADAAFIGYSPRPMQYIPCGNVPHILWPTPFPTQYFSTADHYYENTNKVETINARLHFNRMNPHERLQRERLTSTSKETDDDVSSLNSLNRKFPATSYNKNNSQPRSNSDDFATKHPYGSFCSNIPIFQFYNPNLRHAATEASDFKYHNRYKYIDPKRRESLLYDSKSITTVEGTGSYENMYGKKLVSTIKQLCLSDSCDKIRMNNEDFAPLHAINRNVTSYKKKETTTLFKNNSSAIDPFQDSELPDILEVSTPTGQTTNSIKLSKSTPLSASPKVTTPADHFRAGKIVTLVTDTMTENVPIEAQCQTSKTQSLYNVKNYALQSTNTSFKDCTALLSKSVGSFNSKFCASVELDTIDTAKEGKQIKNYLTTQDASILLNENREKSLYKIKKYLSADHINSFTKLGTSKLPDAIKDQDVKNTFRQILKDNKNIATEEIDDLSSNNVLVFFMKNVVGKFKMLASQVTDIFYNSRNEHDASNLCSTVRSEGLIEVRSKNTSIILMNNQKCLTVKLLTFRNERGN